MKEEARIYQQKETERKELFSYETLTKIRISALKEGRRQEISSGMVVFGQQTER